MFPSISASVQPDDCRFLSIEMASGTDLEESSSCSLLALISRAVFLSVDKQRMKMKNGPIYVAKHEENGG